MTAHPRCLLTVKRAIMVCNDLVVQCAFFNEWWAAMRLNGRGIYVFRRMSRCLLAVLVAASLQACSHSFEELQQHAAFGEKFAAEASLNADQLMTAEAAEACLADIKRNFPTAAATAHFTQPLKFNKAGTQLNAQNLIRHGPKELAGKIYAYSTVAELKGAAGLPQNADTECFYIAEGNAPATRLKFHTRCFFERNHTCGLQVLPSLGKAMSKMF